MNLLLYLSPYSYRFKNVISSTLSWLCNEKGYDFEVYYESLRSGAAYGGPPAKHEDYFGSTVLGGRHYEQYYKLNNFYNMKYAISNEHHTFNFLLDRSDIIVNSKLISTFYNQIFSYFKRNIPSQAIIIGTLHSHKVQTFELDANSYPEIYFRKALGLMDDVSDIELKKLKEMGLKELLLLCVDKNKIKNYEKLGFNVTEIDSIKSDDDIKSIMTRLSKRWLSSAKGFFYGDPILTAHWIPWCCRNKFIPIYGTDLNEILVNNESSRSTWSKVIFGRQDKEEDIFIFSNYDYSFQIVDPGRPIFPIVENIDYSIFEPTKSLYDLEPSDSTLEKYANENKILSSLLFWCPDLRHLECLYRLLDLVTVTKVKIGIGLTSFAYKYLSDIMQFIYLPIEQGGVFPNVEILLCSLGLGVASEASNYMNYDKMYEHIKTSKELILHHIGERFLPKGCYPFLDINFKNVLRPKKQPFFISKFRKQINKDNKLFFKALYDNNFEYVVSFKNPGRPKINYRKDNFVAINFTAGVWTGVSPYITINNVNEYKKVEEKLLRQKKPGWILSAIDSPLWLYSKEVWDKGHDLWEIFQYILQRHMSNDVINVTPHTIARYANIICA